MQAHFSLKNHEGFCDIGVQHPTSVLPRESRHFVCMGPARAVRKVTLKVSCLSLLLAMRLLPALLLPLRSRRLVGGALDTQRTPRLLVCYMPCWVRAWAGGSSPRPNPSLLLQPGELWVGDASFTAHDEYWPLAPWEVEDPSLVPVRESSPEFLPGWSRARRSASLLDDDAL